MNVGFCLDWNQLHQEGPPQSKHPRPTPALLWRALRRKLPQNGHPLRASPDHKQALCASKPAFIEEGGVSP